jgi:hypothetical protein
MATGTIGAIKALEIEKQRKRIIAMQKQNELANNREKAIKAVCDAFGWSKLEPWAESKLNILFNGGMVDVKQLVADLAEWKKVKEEQKEDVSQAQEEKKEDVLQVQQG